MKGVWSFWTKPIHTKRWWSGWESDLHHFYSWVLSVETAKPHFQETVLYTDDDGARLLIDDIGLMFDHVSTELNILDSYDSEWWAIGKLLTYSLQTEPFVHLDSDVFLWKPLPERLICAPLLAQNPEFFSTLGSWYYPQKFDLLKRLSGWVPEELDWYRTSNQPQKAVCCGIFGGNQLDFIHYYTELAMNALLHPANQPLWAVLGGDNILIEQYLLAACIEYHIQQENNRYQGIHIEYLFSSPDDAFNPASSNHAGYTHLIGGAKRSSRSLERIEARVQQEYPYYYERCKRL